MSSFFSPDVFKDHKFQLFATALISGATAASLVFGYQALDKKERLSELKRSIPSLDQEHEIHRINSYGGAVPMDKEDERNQALAKRAQQGDFDEELVLEQLARNRVFLTPEGLDKLRSSFVIVVGCGGVGSHAAASLARSGVSKLRLVDFDQVTLSSLNRHAVATLADVGISKVHCLERRLIAIAPWVRFDLRQEKFEGSVASRLLAPWEDGTKPFVIDAIDNIDSKVELLKYCHDNQLQVISSMGAGCKSDPTRVTVGDIGTGTDDRLSRATRRRLKLLGVTAGIPIVYSTEKTGDGKAELLPLPEEEFKKGTVGDLGPMANFRVRILPVLGSLPAVFGLTIATHIMLSISGYPTEYVTAKGRDKLYDGILSYTQSSEEKLHRLLLQDKELDGIKIPVTVNDVAFLVDEMYKGRSAVTGLSTKLVLIRWRKPGPDNLLVIGDQKSSKLGLSELVCMTKDEAWRHDFKIFQSDQAIEDVYDKETIERVEARLAEIKEYEKYRQ